MRATEGSVAISKIYVKHKKIQFGIFSDMPHTKWKRTDLLFSPFANEAFHKVNIVVPLPKIRI